MPKSPLFSLLTIYHQNLSHLRSSIAPISQRRFVQTQFSYHGLPLFYHSAKWQLVLLPVGKLIAFTILVIKKDYLWIDTRDITVLKYFLCFCLLLSALKYVVQNHAPQRKSYKKLSYEPVDSEPFILRVRACLLVPAYMSYTMYIVQYSHVNCILTLMATKIVPPGWNSC